MKGIMVPLLILGMTGIVVGQQTNSSSFRSTVYRPITQSDTHVPGVSTPRIDESKIKPLDLSVSDQDIQGIRNGAELLSIIEPRDPKTNQLLALDVVSGITLIHKKNLNQKLPVKKMTAEYDKNGKIKIGLDNWDLSDLENSRLSFVFPVADRGKFDRVAFYYKAPKPASDSVLDTGFGSTAGNPQPNNARISLGQPPQGTGFLPRPGPEAIPGDIEFHGPVMPTRQTQVAENDHPGGWSPATTPANGWKMPQEDLNQESLGQYQSRMLQQKLQQDRLEQARLEQARFDKEQLRIQELSRIQRINDAQRTPSNRTAWPNTAQLRQTAPVNSPLNQPGLTDQEIAERMALIKRQRHIQADEEALATREANLKRQKNEFEYQRYVENLKAYEIDDFASSDSRQSSPIAGTSYAPSRSSIERPERLAMNSAFDSNRQSPTSQRQVNSNITPRLNGGVRNMAAMLPPPTGNNGSQIDASNRPDGTDPLTQEKKEKRTEGFIYFMLLCSLGLNVYLGLISRGFYVRYNELADELRETFTAPM